MYDILTVLVALFMLSVAVTFSLLMLVGVVVCIIGYAGIPLKRIFTRAERDSNKQGTK